MKYKVINFSLIALLFFSYSCTTRSPSSDSSTSYLPLIRAEVQTQKSYDGLTNTMESSLVFLTPELRQAQIHELARTYGWSFEKTNEEKSKNLESTSSQVVFFLAFYSPEKKLNQLEKVKSPFHIFLEADGKRYAAQIKRTKQPTFELKKLYPFLSQWHIPYEVAFPLPLENLKEKEFSFEIAGPGGHQVFKFSYP